MNIIVKNFLFLFAVACLISCNIPGHKQYDFVGDGVTLNTEALQRAIDECSQQGGGTISLPKGNYLTGTIFLKKGVTLHLEKDAVIVGNKQFDNYPEPHGRKALIFAEFADDIAITGEGQIDGNGSHWAFEDDPTGRPMIIAFYDCKNVTVTGVKMKNPGFWAFRLTRCDGVIIQNVHLDGHANWNNDGMDIESRNVTITDCVIDTEDDALCFKSGDPNFVVENITVENCKLSSNCNFIKFGTASAGGFRNVKVSNCILYKCSRSLCHTWEKYLPGVTNPITGISGIALEVVDGGFMDNILISDIRMEDVQTPVFIRLGRRNTSDSSWLKDIIIENITASSESLIASSITGVPGLRVENVEFRNIFFKLKGGGKASDMKLDVPEVETAYPENRMFGVMLPAYGFYLRHADNIRFKNIFLQTSGTSDERPVFVADDVTNLEIKNSILQPPTGDQPVIYLRSCKNIRLIENKLFMDPAEKEKCAELYKKGVGRNVTYQRLVTPVGTDCTVIYTEAENTPDSEIEIKDYVFKNWRW